MRSTWMLVAGLALAGCGEHTAQPSLTIASGSTVPPTALAVPYPEGGWDGTTAPRSSVGVQPSRLDAILLALAAAPAVRVPDADYVGAWKARPVTLRLEGPGGGVEVPAPEGTELDLRIVAERGQLRLLGPPDLDLVPDEDGLRAQGGEGVCRLTRVGPNLVACLSRQGADGSVITLEFLAQR